MVYLEILFMLLPLAVPVFIVVMSFLFLYHMVKGDREENANKAKELEIEELRLRARLQAAQPRKDGVP